MWRAETARPSSPPPPIGRAASPSGRTGPWKPEPEASSLAFQSYAYALDTLTGSDGNNPIVGGAGNDTLFGGAGSDLFAFGNGSGGSVVMDFTAGTDRLALTDSPISLADVIASAQVVGGSTVLDLRPGSSVTIQGRTGDVARWFA